MSTVINTNLASLFAQNSLTNAQNNLATSVQRLSSGLRINSAKDDAAGLAISQNMQSQILGTNQSINNLSDATNLLQTADSSLSTIQDMLLKMKQLAVQGYDGSLNTTQKADIVTQMQDLNTEINATAQRTQFNGINLLSSGSSIDLNNSDLKVGTAISNTAVSVLTSTNTAGLGFYSGSGNATGLGDAALGALGGVGNANTSATTYTIAIDPKMATQVPGSYVLTSNGNALTMTGTFNGLSQSQTVNVGDALGNSQAGAGLTTDQSLNFSNFGISINLHSVRGSGDSISGTTMASQLASNTYKNLTVSGTGGVITDVNLSGVAPGTYTMSYNRTGGIGSLSAGLGQSISASGTAQTAQAITLSGGSGTSATATVDYDANGNITNLTVTAAGSGYKSGDLLTGTKSTTITGSANVATTATGTITLAAMNAGDTLSIHGITFTASQNLSATQVASSLVSLAAGGGASNSSGTANGTRTAGVAFTSSASGVLTITNTTGGNLSLTASESKTINNIIVGPDITNITGNKTLTMSGNVNGIATTQSLAISDNAALATENINFSSFGVSFNLKSNQAQTADQIGTALATLNMGVGSSVAGGPGQVIVATGNNSNLQFQSGPSSSAFIGINTANVQTGTTGQYAGSSSAMIGVGTVITNSGSGNLGALGNNDTIATWQQAFQNAAAAVDKAVDYISTQRATYGSQMNRLSYISSNLTAQSTNLQTSKSAITDTNFAAETATLTKGQIMQQAATAMLAQANQMPNVILSLLK